MFLPIVMVFMFYNYYGLDFLVYAGWGLLAVSVVVILLAGGMHACMRLLRRRRAQAQAGA
jgi:hypothetical protein